MTDALLIAGFLFVVLAIVGGIADMRRRRAYREYRLRNPRVDNSDLNALLKIVTRQLDR